MTVGELLLAVRRLWLLVLAVIAGCTAAGFLLVYLTPPTYLATARVLAVMPDTTPAEGVAHGTGGLAPMLFVSTRIPEYASYADTHDFRRRVVDRYRLSVDPDKLRDVLTVSWPRQTSIMEVTVRSESPTLAADIANAAAEELAKVIPERDSRLPIRAVVAQHALVPLGRIAPQGQRITVQAALFGAIVGTSFAAAVARSRPRRTIGNE